MLRIERIKLVFLVFISLLFLNLQFIPVLAYDFEMHSGVGDTGDEAGYNDVNLTDDSVAQMVGDVIRQIILYLGVFFLLLTIYAGFIWMFSRGNDQEVEKAKKRLQNALIGLIVVLLAYTITYLFMHTLTGVQSEPVKITP